MMMKRIVGSEHTDQSAERKSGTLFAVTLKREVLFRLRQATCGGGDNREDPNDIVSV
jgi:hypothetical protein